MNVTKDTLEKNVKNVANSVTSVKMKTYVPNVSKLKTPIKEELVNYVNVPMDTTLLITMKVTSWKNVKTATKPV